MTSVFLEPALVWVGGLAVASLTPIEARLSVFFPDLVLT